MFHLGSVGITNFCISDTPVFLNLLIRLETAGIRGVPPEVSPCHFFSDINKPESSQDCMGRPCRKGVRQGTKGWDPLFCSCIIGAGGEINFCAAFVTFMGFVKFIRENFLGCIACRAFTGKGFQVFKIFKSRAMLRCTHDGLLFLGYRFSVCGYSLPLSRLSVNAIQ